MSLTKMILKKLLTKDAIEWLRSLTSDPLPTDDRSDIKLLLQYRDPKYIHYVSPKADEIVVLPFPQLLSYRGAYTGRWDARAVQEQAADIMEQLSTGQSSCTPTP